VAPLIDFQTPPLAEPAKTVIFPSSSTASIAAMRPLMVAEPMFLAVRPEMVPESYSPRWFARDCGDRTQVEHKHEHKNHCSLQSVSREST